MQSSGAFRGWSVPVHARSFSLLSAVPVRRWNRRTGAATSPGESPRHPLTARRPRTRLPRNQTGKPRTSRTRSTAASHNRTGHGPKHGVRLPRSPGNSEQTSCRRQQGPRTLRLELFWTSDRELQKYPEAFADRIGKITRGISSSETAPCATRTAPGHCPRTYSWNSFSYREKPAPSSHTRNGVRTTSIPSARSPE